MFTILPQFQVWNFYFWVTKINVETLKFWNHGRTSLPEKRSSFPKLPLYDFNIELSIKPIQIYLSPFLFLSSANFWHCTNRTNPWLYGTTWAWKTWTEVSKAEYFKMIRFEFYLWIENVIGTVDTVFRQCKPTYTWHKKFLGSFKNRPCANIQQL